MKAFLAELRMSLAEWLLFRAASLAPQTKDGQRLRKHVARYAVAVALTMPYETKDHP